MAGDVRLPAGLLFVIEGEVTTVNFETLSFRGGKLVILDQTLLPNEEKYVELRTKEEVYDAIKRLMVRGAPAIGDAAGYGLYVSVRGSEASDLAAFRGEVLETAEYLNSSRPTAVNLSWALKRMLSRLDAYIADAEKSDGSGTSSETADDKSGVEGAKQALLSEADAIFNEDVESCRRMGEHGLTLLKPGMGILTHCNAGALATARYGTCLSPVYLGEEQGYGFHVFADETRPLLQGARLTSWELKKAGVDVTLICDNMAASAMRRGWIDAVVVGCDRMAANGDGANKIGTFQVAIMAREYGIPFYMFVPTSTIDLETDSGDDIVIEERDGEEIYKMWYEKPMAPEGVKTFNPSFDVTDHKFITAVVTEKGIARPPYTESLRRLVHEL